MPNPKHSGGYRLGIVNPLTLVGNEVKSILRERSFPVDKIVLLDSLDKAAGAIAEVGDEPVIVTPISGDELEDLDLVFFCGDASRNDQWILRAADDRFLAVELSQPSLSEDRHLAIAGVNLEELGEVDARVFASPHPVAIPIALILHQIEKVAPVALCTATVVQPASIFEQAGIDELAAQTISVLNIKSVPSEVFERQLAFNLYPAPQREEVSIITQIRKLIDPQTEIALLITQGTIFHGHTFSLFVTTRTPADIEALKQSLKDNPAIVLPDAEEAFGTIDAAGKDEVLIAEIRKDPSIAGGFWVWAVCDNLRRSSALNAVLVAEKILFGTGVH